MFYSHNKLNKSVIIDMKRLKLTMNFRLKVNHEGRTKIVSNIIKIGTFTKIRTFSIQLPQLTRHDVQCFASELLLYF